MVNAPTRCEDSASRWPRCRGQEGGDAGAAGAAVTCRSWRPRWWQRRRRGRQGLRAVTSVCFSLRVTGGELFEDIVAREYYSEADARWVWTPRPPPPSPLRLSLTGPLPALRPASAPVTGARAGEPASASVCRPRRWTLWEQVAQRGGSCLLRPRAPRLESGSTQACQFLLGWEVAHSGCCPWGGQWPVAGEWCPPAVAQVGTLAAFPEASGGAGGGPVPLAVLPGTPPRPRVMSGPSRGTLGSPPRTRGH